MTAPAVPEGLEPLAVLDPREDPPRYSPFEVHQLIWWTIGQLGVRVTAAERIEIYQFDGPFAVVHPYPPGAAPVIVPLTELPPAHLLKG